MTIEVPNLPGMRRDLSATRCAYNKQKTDITGAGITGSAEYDAIKADSQRLSPYRNNSKVWQTSPSSTTKLGEDAFDSSDSQYNSVRSSQDIKDLKLSIQAFPAQADSFNDVNGRYSLRSQQIDRSLNVKAIPYSNLDGAPHFVANEKEPLCRILAYYIESVPYNGIEQERARKVEIIFYLEDSTLEIIEQYIPNCGIIQGNLFLISIFFVIVMRFKIFILVHGAFLACIIFMHFLFYSQVLRTRKLVLGVLHYHLIFSIHFSDF